MTASYPEIRSVHVAAVALSGSLFLLRGAAALLGARWPHATAVRRVSQAIDTVLLAAALALVAILPAGHFANHWLSVKLARVVAYVALGMLALRPGRPRHVRALGFAAALATFALIVGIAIARDPLGWWRLLAG